MFAPIIEGENGGETEVVTCGRPCALGLSGPKMPGASFFRRVFGFSWRLLSNGLFIPTAQMATLCTRSGGVWIAHVFGHRIWSTCVYGYTDPISLVPGQPAALHTGSPDSLPSEFFFLSGEVEVGGKGDSQAHRTWQLQNLSECAPRPLK